MPAGAVAVSKRQKYCYIGRPEFQYSEILTHICHLIDISMHVSVYACDPSMPPCALGMDIFSTEGFIITQAPMLCTWVLANRCIKYGSWSVHLCVYNCMYTYMPVDSMHMYAHTQSCILVHLFIEVCTCFCRSINWECASKDDDVVQPLAKGSQHWRPCRFLEAEDFFGNTNCWQQAVSSSFCQCICGCCSMQRQP